ncbi:MAG: type II secretion system protein [Candidatus Eisenbacteria bacterium]|uniref:Type II secretion system protein n=1 Tax=Eiseniibacteriota bacterium TaxID=2212470 RepID=A0A9D6QNI9_UNCEI|nr:type II secretion system protein [Candidatus Eisenbacteria bacterium]MBI3538989.1 type II secretion system protein [Candidatus Eisenbacteria bacterium]
MNERIHLRASGFTLIEVMVVMILAGVVTLGLVGFYLNSQSTWIDGSSQALAQRDATTILESIASRADSAASVQLTAVPPDTVLEFYRVGSALPYYGFRWGQGAGEDSLLHQGPGSCNPDQGPVVPSVVERFSVTLDANPKVPVLHVASLRVRSATGQVVEVSSSFALRNAP